MERRRLGLSSLKVSALALGTMNFGSNWHGTGAVDEKSAARLVDMALDAGVNLIDTADIYGRGASEEMLGRILKGRRSRVLLASKVLGRMIPDDPLSGGLGRAHILAGVEASLKRLKTDWLDLYMPHGYDPQVPLEESLEAFELLVQSGKVRVLGCSNFSGEQLERSLVLAAEHSWNRFEFDQVQYSAAARFIEKDLVASCRNRSVSVLAWSPLGGGFLSGKYAAQAKPEGRRSDPSGERFPSLPEGRLQSLLALLSRIAALEGLSSAQAALGYVLSKPWIAAAIVGARRPEQLEETLAAKPLSRRSVELLDQAGELCSVL